MAKTAVIKGFKQSILAKGHAGYYSNGEHMSREISRFLETSVGRIDITSLSDLIKQRLGRQRFPTENVMNTKLAGKTMDLSGNYLQQIVSYLKK